MEQSPHAQVLHAWAQFFVGNLAATSDALAVLRGRDDENVRALRINLGITSGNWDALNELVSAQWENRSDRTAKELLHTAQLGLLVDSPRVADLTRYVARAGYDDASVLAGAYFLATRAGWENDADVASWLMRAAQLSGPGGPIQKLALSDVLKLEPEWDKRAADASEKISRGETPLFAAAYQVNRTLLEVTIAQALNNRHQVDVRLRAPVFAFSGARGPSKALDFRSVAIDPTGLYTLALLGLLEPVMAAVDRVLIAHSTLLWIFQETAKVRFHQPSQVALARHLLELIALDHIKILRPAAVVDPRLVSDVGLELATLLSTAEESASDVSRQTLVVRSAPVYRVRSLMGEEADLTDHVPRLVGCQTVVAKLRERGLLATGEYEKAHAYLCLQERDWPSTTQISDGAHLLLDGLSVNYLQHLGLLSKLSRAALEVFILDDERQNANSLISHGQRADQTLSTVSALRRVLAAAIASGKVRLTPSSDDDGHEDSFELRSNPSITILQAARDVDALAIDDRFVNRHANFIVDDKEIPIITTLDLIATLQTQGRLERDTAFSMRTELRRYGYCFVPLTLDELLYHLKHSSVVDGALVETAELKAIRESVRAVQMRDTLQLPSEGPWLEELARTLTRAIKALWMQNDDVAVTRARAEWAFQLVDARGWAHFVQPSNDPGSAEMAHRIQMFLFMTAPSEADDDVANLYRQWVDEFLILPAKEAHPERFSWLLDRVRGVITEHADSPAHEGTVGEIGAAKPEPSTLRSARALAISTLFPLSLQEALIDDPAFRDEFGLTTRSTIAFSSNLAFDRSRLLSTIRGILNSKGDRKTELVDTAGVEWTISAAGAPPDTRVFLMRDDAHFEIPSFGVLMSAADDRRKVIEAEAAKVGWPKHTTERWLQRFDTDADDHDALAFNDDIADTPPACARQVDSDLSRKKLTLRVAVPQSCRYYERLVGRHAGEPMVADYARAGGRERLRDLVTWRSVDGYRFGLLLSSHRSLCSEVPIDLLRGDEVAETLGWLASDGDLYSMLGGIETGLRGLQSLPAIRRPLTQLIHRLIDTFGSDGGSRYRLLSALIKLVDGEVARARLFADAPPFYRRLATIAQASLLERLFLGSDADSNGFAKWAAVQRSQPFALQSLIDLRREPRWQYRLAEAEQLKHEFVGRVLNAARTYATSIAELGLQSALTEGDDCLAKRFPWYLTSLPGPLEGTIQPREPMPEDLAALVLRDLESRPVTARSFVPLINVRHIFALSDRWPEVVAKVLRQSEDGIPEYTDRAQLLAVLEGLADFSAVTRSKEVASELTSCVRSLLRRGAREIEILDAFQLTIEAAASYEDLGSWCAFLRDNLTALAYQPISSEDAEILLSSIEWLCHLRPELSRHCSRALAALQSVSDE